MLDCLFGINGQVLGQTEMKLEYFHQGLKLCMRARGAGHDRAFRQVMLIMVINSSLPVAMPFPQLIDCMAKTYQHGFVWNGVSAEVMRENRKTI